VPLGVLFGTLLGLLPGIAFVMLQSALSGRPAPVPVTAPAAVPVPAGTSSVLQADSPAALVGLIGIGIGIFLGAMVGALVSEPADDRTFLKEGAGSGAVAGGVVGTMGCIFIVVLALILAFFVALCGGFLEALTLKTTGQADATANQMVATGLMMGFLFLAGGLLTGSTLGALGALLGAVVARQRRGEAEPEV
jgi:hypothetical protein